MPRPEPSKHEQLLLGLEAQALENGHGDIARELREVMAQLRRDEQELEALRQDALRALKIAYQVTPEAESLEEACAALVALVRQARGEPHERP
jgi:hypothetical protein